jgi:hypothetical protein
MARQVGRRAYGAITAVQNLAVLGGSAAGPLVVGALYDRTQAYELALILIVVVIACGALTTLLAPRPSEPVTGSAQGSLRSRA